jgi:hypothetical protein
MVVSVTIVKSSALLRFAIITISQYQAVMRCGLMRRCKPPLIRFILSNVRRPMRVGRSTAGQSRFFQGAVVYCVDFPSQPNQSIFHEVRDATNFMKNFLLSFVKTSTQPSGIRLENNYES